MNRIGILLVSIMLAIGNIAAEQLVRQVDHVQPGCGLVLWPDNAADLNDTYGQAVQLEFQYALPCKVVTGKQNGQILYDWTWLETILNDVASRGHQAVLRWRYAYPSSKDVDGSTKGMTAVPAYIKTLTDYHETYKKVSGDGPTYYPDWSNAELQWFTKQFYADFEAQYGQDPRIAYLEVGFGHWAEYHIYGNTLNLGNNFPSKQYQSSFFQHLDTTMTIPWLVSIDAGDDQYSPMQTDAAMQACTFGLFDDSFMHSEHDFSQGEGWNEQCWQWSDPQGTRWHTGVNGGEVSYYTDDDQHNFLNPAGMYGVTWEQAAAKYHLTFINANDAPEGSYGTAARFRTAGMATGYHFQVTQVTTGGGTTQVTVTNTGIAPIYRDAYFAINGTRSTTSLKGLLPGQQLMCAIAADLNNGADLSIKSDYILSSQQIQFDADCTIETATALNDTKAAGQALKWLQNGRLMIKVGNKIYDCTGRAF